MPEKLILYLTSKALICHVLKDSDQYANEEMDM